MTRLLIELLFSYPLNYSRYLCNIWMKCKWSWESDKVHSDLRISLCSFIHFHSGSNNRGHYWQNAMFGFFRRVQSVSSNAKISHTLQAQYKSSFNPRSIHILRSLPPPSSISQPIVSARNGRCKSIFHGLRKDVFSTKRTAVSRYPRQHARREISLIFCSPIITCISYNIDEYKWISTIRRIRQRLLYEKYIFGSILRMERDIISTCSPISFILYSMISRCNSHFMLSCQMYMCALKCDLCVCVMTTLMMVLYRKKMWERRDESGENVVYHSFHGSLVDDDAWERERDAE